MSQVRDTKKALMRSKVWAAATRDLNVEAMVETGQMAMDAWDDDTHEAVRSWAGVGGEMPEVVATYLAQFEESGETPECWGNDAARPDEIEVEGATIKVTGDPSNERKFKVEIGVSDPAVADAIKESQEAVTDTVIGPGLILRRDGGEKSWAWIFTVPDTDIRYGDAYGWDHASDEHFASSLARNGAREFLGGMLSGRANPEHAAAIPEDLLIAP